MAQASRAFLRRAVRMCAASGVTQFLDIGSGIPTVGNVHEIARAADPQSRVVYVDTDPVAVSHTRQMLGDDPTTTVLRGDLRDPVEILDSPELRGTLDLDRPVAVMLIMILHFIRDEDDPVGILARFREALPPGSMLAIAHGSPNTENMPDEHLHGAREMYEKSVAQVRLRTRREVQALFHGWELVEPAWCGFPTGAGSGRRRPRVRHPERRLRGSGRQALSVRPADLLVLGHVRTEFPLVRHERRLVVAGLKEAPGQGPRPDQRLRGAHAAGRRGA
ncbi:SAM-dependent methyltransferase, partial [Kutzneria kofuensis]|uniref:SAM-dependent methyltransferase n=1 Tax=Kutzneria kofuensis TaxID=103725 RepID=UPI0031ED741B